MTESFDAMEFIWERLPKNSDGTIQYLPGDIPYLYKSGFVDATRFTYEQWKKAFDFCKNDDGTFTLSKAEFLSLRIFRFTGPTHEVFDPWLLREGPWPDEELDYLYLKSIKPSSTISKEIFWNSVKALKKQGFVNDKNELIVNDKIKQQVQYLVDKYPSPKRLLEKEVKRLREEKDIIKEGHQKNRDQTSFSIGKSQKEVDADKFKNLEAAGSKKKTKEKKTKIDEIDIKSLRKPTNKFKG